MIRYEAERKHQRGNLYEGEKDIKVLGKGTASLRYFRSNCLEFSLMKTDLVRKKRRKKNRNKGFFLFASQLLAAWKMIISTNIHLATHDQLLI